MSTTAPSLTPEQLETFGQELDEIRARVVADLGERDVEAERIAAGESTLDDEKREKLAAVWRKVRGQTLKDYVLFPLLSGPSFPFVLAGNATANLTRNLWAFTIIFCGQYQIEHHLFPDLPAHRYGEIAEEVREIRERYGIPYNTGPLHRQFGSVVRKIARLALPPLPGLRHSEPVLDEPAADAKPPKLTAAKSGPRKLTAAA